MTSVVSFRTKGWLRELLGMDAKADILDIKSFQTCNGYVYEGTIKGTIDEVDTVAIDEIVQ